MTRNITIITAVFFMTATNLMAHGATFAEITILGGKFIAPEHHVSTVGKVSTIWFLDGTSFTASDVGGGGGGGGGGAIFNNVTDTAFTTFTILGAKYDFSSGFATITVLFEGVLSASHTGSNFWSSTQNFASEYSLFLTTHSTRVDELQVYVSTGQELDVTTLLFFTTHSARTDELQVHVATSATQMKALNNFLSTHSSRTDELQVHVSSQQTQSEAFKVTFSSIQDKLSNGAISIYDSGSQEGNATTLNFTSNLSVSFSGSTATVSGTGGGGGGGAAALDVYDGGDFTTVSTVSFPGATISFDGSHSSITYMPVIKSTWDVLITYISTAQAVGISTQNIQSYAAGAFSTTSVRIDQLEVGISSVAPDFDSVRSSMVAIRQSTSTFFGVFQTTTAGLSSSAGSVNDGGNPVHWNQIRGVPAGFADETDDTGGGGGTGGQIVYFTGTSNVSMGTMSLVGIKALSASGRTTFYIEASTLNWTVPATFGSTVTFKATVTISGTESPVISSTYTSLYFVLASSNAFEIFVSSAYSGGELIVTTSTVENTTWTFTAHQYFSSFTVSEGALINAVTVQNTLTVEGGSLALNGVLHVFKGEAPSDNEIWKFDSTSGLWGPEADADTGGGGSGGNGFLGVGTGTFISGTGKVQVSSQIQTITFQEGLFTKQLVDDVTAFIGVDYSSSINVKWKRSGSLSGQGSAIDFRGGNFDVVMNGEDYWLVELPDKELSVPIIIRDEGSYLSTTTNINFVGAGVSVVRTGDGSTHTVTISGGGSGSSDNFGSHIATRIASFPNGVNISSGVVESSLTVRGVIISTTGALLGGTTIQGELSMGTTLAFKTKAGAEMYKIVFGSAPSAGQKMGVLKVTGNYVLIGGVGDQTSNEVPGSDVSGGYPDLIVGAACTKLKFSRNVCVNSVYVSGDLQGYNLYE